MKSWIVGSSEVRLPTREHLVIKGSPRPIRDYRRVPYAPYWRRGERADVGGWIAVHGWRARWVFVPHQTDNIFAGHVVLAWTTGGHTYAVGFHDWNRHVTRAMDLELVRHMRMVVG
jgi:hypothetical protein